MITPDESVHPLLLATLQRFVAADAQIKSSTSIPLQGGMSGSAVVRHTIQYTTALDTPTTSLITKDADRHEWRVLQHLQSQQPEACLDLWRIIPFFEGLRGCETWR